MSSNSNSITDTQPVSELRFNLSTITSALKLPPLTAPITYAAPILTSTPTFSRPTYHARHRSEPTTAPPLPDRQYSNHHRYQSSNCNSTETTLSPCAEALTPDGRLDLSLGQERAGGGFGGRQAKLGKLIVEGEGLAMLDLVVAANMGIWWRGYERWV